MLGGVVLQQVQQTADVLDGVPQRPHLAHPLAPTTVAPQSSCTTVYNTTDSYMKAAQQHDDIHFLAVAMLS